MTEGQAYKKALKRKTRYRTPALNPAVIIATLLLAAVIISCAVVIMSRNNGGSAVPGGTLANTESGVPAEDAVTDAPESAPSPEGITVTMTPEDVHRGNLILVNFEYGYQFPESPTDICVFDNKTLSYKVSDKEVSLSPAALTPFNSMMDDFYEATGCYDVLMVDGYRTEEFQRQLYDERAAAFGEEYAAMYVATPGYSEHHTGLAVDLSVYTDSGEGYELSTYEKCSWLKENFENYGFILRYPQEKASITGISYESWHYRYVGYPHSLIMKERGLCYEEYVQMIQELGEDRAIVWDGSASFECAASDINGRVAVYYVPANPEGNTEIVIPKDREYTVSGDNVGGFIVTLDPYTGVLTENE